MHGYLTCLLAACYIIRAQGSQSCSRFGNDLVQTTGIPQTTGTFVNIPTALSCPGNATQWNVCYYSSTSSQMSTTYFGVYRLSSGTTYNLIDASQTTYSTFNNGSEYTCNQLTISPQYVLQPGDILVVCVQTQDGSNGLGIVGTASTITSILLDPTACFSLPGATIDTSTYNANDGATLHVSLDVNECAVNNGECGQICTDITLGNNCSCYSGYSLDANLKNCNDINECLTNNGGCAQICTNTIGSYTCLCSSGYLLAIDSRTCNDINECSNQNGNCTQICTNSVGSYACSCNENYALLADLRSCYVLSSSTSGLTSTILAAVIPSLFGALFVIFVIAFSVHCYLRKRKPRYQVMEPVVCEYKRPIHDSGVYTIARPLPLPLLYDTATSIHNQAHDTEYVSTETDEVYETTYSSFN